MIRGFKLMKCTECGKRFWGPDIELGASALSQPIRCPKCGSIRTRPSRLLSPFTSDTKYKIIWNQMETVVMRTGNPTSPEIKSKMLVSQQNKKKKGIMR